MQHIYTYKNGIGIYFEAIEGERGGECLIVDEKKHYTILEEVFGHTKQVAIYRARKISKEYNLYKRH